MAPPQGTERNSSGASSMMHGRAIHSSRRLRTPFHFLPKVVQLLYSTMFVSVSRKPHALASIRKVVTAVAFLNNDRGLLTCGQDSFLRVWSSKLEQVEQIEIGQPAFGLWVLKVKVERGLLGLAWD